MAGEARNLTGSDKVRVKIDNVRKVFKDKKIGMGRFPIPKKDFLGCYSMYASTIA